MKNLPESGKMKGDFFRNMGKTPLEPQKTGIFSSLTSQDDQEVDDKALFDKEHTFDSLVQGSPLLERYGKDQGGDDFVDKGELDFFTEQGSKNRIVAITKMVEQVLIQVEKIQKSLREIVPFLQERKRTLSSPSAFDGQSQELGRVLTGVFDGQNMIGDDGKEYTVPPNYASKSKLLEGDTLKLIIEREGRFIYKQIQPVDRKRITATLDYDILKNQYIAVSGERVWRLLMAAVTYFKGEKGDEVILLIPQEKPSRWAAVENIIK